MMFCIICCADNARTCQDAACVYFVLQFVAGGELFRTIKARGTKCGPRCKSRSHIRLFELLR